MPSQPTREIALEDTFNLRDLGGYTTVDGRRVRWRRLFRGAGLHRLAGADVERARALGLVTAIDLRTVAELDARGAFPSGALPARVHHLPLIASIWNRGAPLPGTAPERFLLERYREMLDEGRPAIVAALRILAEPESLPAAFYCAAGKDRTGVLAALVLGALGVGREQIVADYHLSAEPVARMVARARAQAQAAKGSPMLQQPPALLAAPPQAMELLLDAIELEHGSLRGYLLEIGVQDETLAGLAAGLLE